MSLTFISDNANSASMNLENSHLQVTDAERLLKAMASAARLMILCEVLKGERTVTELHQALGASMSSISQHLAVLRDEGIVSTRRASQHVHYSLANGAAERLLDTLHQIYCPPAGASPAANSEDNTEGKSK